MKNKLFIIMLVGILICVGIFAGVFWGRSSIKNTVIINQNSKTASANAPKNKPMDINEVSEDDLVINLQISRSLAREIVNYRKTYGEYVYISELKNIPGMTDEVYQQIRPYLTLSD